MKSTSCGLSDNQVDNYFYEIFVPSIEAMPIAEARNFQGYILGFECGPDHKSSAVSRRHLLEAAAEDALWTANASYRDTNVKQMERHARDHSVHGVLA